MLPFEKIDIAEVLNVRSNGNSCVGVIDYFRL